MSYGAFCFPILALISRTLPSIWFRLCPPFSCQFLFSLSPPPPPLADRERTPCTTTRQQSIPRFSTCPTPSGNALVPKTAFPTHTACRCLDDAWTIIPSCASCVSECCGGLRAWSGAVSTCCENVRKYGTVFQYSLSRNQTEWRLAARRGQRVRGGMVAQVLCSSSK